MEKEPAHADERRGDLKEDEHGADSNREILMPEGDVVVGEAYHMME